MVELVDPVIKAEVLDKIFEGVEPVTNVISVVNGGLVTFKISTFKVENGLAHEPVIAFTFIWPPDKPTVAVIEFIEDVPVHPLGKIQT